MLEPKPGMLVVRNNWHYLKIGDPAVLKVLRTTIQNHTVGCCETMVILKHLQSGGDDKMSLTRFQTEYREYIPERESTVNDVVYEEGQTLYGASELSVGTLCIDSCQNVLLVIAELNSPKEFINLRTGSKTSVKARVIPSGSRISITANVQGNSRD